MRFLADESCDFAVVTALRKAGHDVTAIAELNPGVEDEVQKHYRQRYSRFAPPLSCSPIETVPSDVARRIAGLRRWFGITQSEFARRIGAANKAVIYQWESRKRTPSIVFWRRIEKLAPDPAHHTDR